MHSLVPNMYFTFLQRSNEGQIVVDALLKEELQMMSMFSGVNWPFILPLDCQSLLGMAE